MNLTPLATEKVSSDPSDTLRLPRVQQRTGLGRSTIYRLISEGKFPVAVKLSPRAVGWHKSDIDAWLNTRPKAAQ